MAALQQRKPSAGHRQGERQAALRTNEGDPKASGSSSGSGSKGDGKEEAASAAMGGGRGGEDSFGVREALLMGLLALQTGLQPSLTSKLVRRDVIIISQVIACEVVKILMGTLSLLLRGPAAVAAVAQAWSWRDALSCALFPAAIYALQNTLIQTAYRHLDGVTFTLLNQTKLISTATCNYLFLRKRQSRPQMLALALMLLAAVLLTVGTGSSNSSNSGTGGDSSSKSSSGSGSGAGGRGSLDAVDAIALGVVPMLVASFTSGLGSTFCQWVLQVRGRNPDLVTMEMCSMSLLLLLLSLPVSHDGVRIRRDGFFHMWTWLSVIPPMSNALGGVLVGYVTKYAGGVRKGFSVIFGLLIASGIQFLLDDTQPSLYIWVALPLVVVSSYMHATCPYVPKKTRTD